MRRILVDPFEVGDDLRTVGDDVQLAIDILLGERHADESDVRGTVFSDKDLESRASGHYTSSLTWGRNNL